MSKYQIRYSNVNAMGPGYGKLLGDISIPNYEYYDATLDEQINAAGTLRFTLLPTNPALSDVAIRKSTIMLYRDNVEIWRGRIIRTEIDMLNRRVCVCEGVLSWLYDILRAGYTADPSGDPPINVIMTLLTDYNQKCSIYRWIEAGTVEPSIKWYGTKDTEYVTIFELLSQLLDNSGGFFRVRYGTYAYLDYLELPTAASGQAVTFGNNLFDLARVIDASNVATTLHAEDSAGHTTTVSEADLETAFGKTEIYHKFDADYGSNITLAVYAKIWLLENCLAQSTINISALDLNLTDTDYNAFYVGQPVRVISTPHGVDTTMILTGLQTNISNPAASQLTLGALPRGITHYVKNKAGLLGSDLALSISQDSYTNILTIE